MHPVTTYSINYPITGQAYEQSCANELVLGDGFGDKNPLYTSAPLSIQWDFSATGTVLENQSFDAWGKRQDPQTGYTYPINLETEWTGLIDRGFTGHEHLDGLALINMNGRIYDPITGRMMQPDNYIQAPGNSQNFNRYSYCLNNPIRYTDPSGEIIWTAITGVADFIATAFFKGGLDPTSSSARQKAWRDFDPTNEDSQTNKAWKIDMGLLKTDPNKNFWGRSWELFSRFTWQAPQTVIGYALSGGHNLFGGVKSVDYYGGATVVETWNKSWGGTTHGSYIMGERGISADPTNRLFQHEYGHYLQSQTFGWFYYSKYGIPSALSKGDYFDHGNHPVEQDANIRALRYFMENEKGFKLADWNFNRDEKGHPIIGFDKTLLFSDPINQAALKNGRTRLEWFDYLLGPNIIISGLVNILIFNSRY